MSKIMVAGIGTDVGKTVVSAILTLLFQGDYWKPIQCGPNEESDSEKMKLWFGNHGHIIHPPAYSFSAPLSPHHAASLENGQIEIGKISSPKSLKPLIIEGVGGILVPLTEKTLAIDLFSSWDCQWVIVSKHYLGSINHTLLTVEALKQRQIPIIGIIFNGTPHSETESVILKMTGIPQLGRLLPEPYLNEKTFRRYVNQWQPNFSHLL